jgi:hypothetical protein
MSRKTVMLLGIVAGAVAVVSFLFLPFVGFTERLEFGGSTI